MKEISDSTCCVVDCGLFLPFALRMAEKCKRVIFCNPELRQFPSIHQGCIGTGFEQLEVVPEFWPDLDEIDFFAFPDIHRSGLQRHLSDGGKPVWGSRKADHVENDREWFMDLLDMFGLNVPPFEVVEGLTNLTDYLKDKEDKYIKVSYWRGDTETQCWRNWKMDQGWIWETAQRYGPLGEDIRFLVFDKIDTPLELGGDTYNVRGQWPELMLNGLEHKDTTYFSAVTRLADMPEQIQEILAAFGPLFSKLDMANQWSMEVRLKDDKGYFIDPTPRGGMPSSASQQLLWDNFPEIVHAAAHGYLLQPEPTHMFTIECAVTAKCGCDAFNVVELPKELDRDVRFSNCCYRDGCYVFPPNENMSGTLGWLVARANTPRACLDRAKEICDQLPDGLEANLENLVGLVKEVEEAEKADITITDEPMPTPAEVVED